MCVKTFHLVHIFDMTAANQKIYNDISCTSLAINFMFCVQFTWQVTNGTVEINKSKLYMLRYD